jgi:hypothetical protein
VLIRSPYCDDPLRTGNLQLQVHVLWHGHKLRVCRPLEDRMVRPRKPTTSKVRVSVRKFRKSLNVRG